MLRIKFAHQKQLLFLLLKRILIVSNNDAIIAPKSYYYSRCSFVLLSFYLSYWFMKIEIKIFFTMNELWLLHNPDNTPYFIFITI